MNKQSMALLLTHFYFPSSHKNLFGELIAISLEQQLLQQSFGISINYHKLPISLKLLGFKLSWVDQETVSLSQCVAAVNHFKECNLHFFDLFLFLHGFTFSNVFSTLKCTDLTFYFILLRRIQLNIKVSLGKLKSNFQYLKVLATL